MSSHILQSLHATPQLPDSLSYSLFDFFSDLGCYHFWVKVGLLAYRTGQLNRWIFCISGRRILWESIGCVDVKKLVQVFSCRFAIRCGVNRCTICAIDGNFKFVFCVIVSKFKFTMLKQVVERGKRGCIQVLQFFDYQIGFCFPSSGFQFDKCAPLPS